MTTLYRCPSVRSNKVVTGEFRDYLHALHETGKQWFVYPASAIEENRIKRNKLIARKAREIQKLSEVY